MAQDSTGSGAGGPGCPGRKDVHPVRCSRGISSSQRPTDWRLCAPHGPEETRADYDRNQKRLKERDAQQRRDMFLSAIQESPSRISKIRRKPC